VITLWNKTPAPILSPCTGVCRLGSDGLCEGCHRSGDEIARWSGYSDAERRRLMDIVLPARAQRQAP
jgi:predicted Fe-S protein YdhL (DUF1289 family)